MSKWEPFSIEAEQQVLGAILLHNSVFEPIQRILQPEHFHEPIHRQIFEICAQQIEAGRVASPVTIKPMIETGFDLGGVTLGEYIARLAASAITITGAIDLAKTVRELHDKRFIFEVAQSMKPTPEADATDLASWVVDQMDTIASQRVSSTVRAVTMEQSMERAVEAAANAYQTEGKMLGLKYGLGDLDQKTLGAIPGNLIILAGRPGMGKFQPLSSPVLTPSGWRKMGDLRCGDLVIGQDGTLVPVTGVFPQGRKPVYRITFSDGRSTLAGAEHLWEVHSKHWGAPRVIDTIEVARLLGVVRYKKWLHVPLYNGGGFASKNLPVPPYTMGAWLGDGSVGRGQITKNDEWIFDKIRSDGFRVSAAGKTRSVYGLIGILNQAGVGKLRSREKFIPEIYFTASYEQRMALLNGLLDTDGTVEPSGTLRYCSSSPLLASDVQRLVRSLGGICKITPKITTHRQTFILSIRHPSSHRLITMPRKAAKLPKNYQYAARLKLRIDKVELVGSDECQCISIDHPRGLYVTDDYAVTHNTALAVCIARNFGLEGYPGDFYSLEMNDTELSQRMIADQMYDQGRFFYSMIRSGKFAPSVFDRIKDAADFLKSLPIRIEQQPQLTLAQIQARARQSHRKGKLKWLMVDHIGLVKPSSRYAGNKVNETGEVTIGLKALAKELEIPVIALAQIGRGVEQREDKRPTLSDLRNSGDIEQDADTVMLLYRESYYLSRKEPAAGSVEYDMWVQDMSRIERRLDLEIAKQRSGPTGSIRLDCEIGANAIRTWKGDFS